MLSFQNHLTCWALSLIAAGIYFVVRFNYIVFPMILVCLAFVDVEDDDEEVEPMKEPVLLLPRKKKPLLPTRKKKPLLPTGAKEPAADLNSFCERYSKEIDLFATGWLIVSMGALIQLFWSNGWIPGPTGSLDQRAVAVLHTLAAFKAISFFQGYHNHWQMSWSVGIHLLIPHGPQGTTVPDVKNMTTFPGWRYICRYIYANVLYKLLVLFLARVVLVGTVLRLCGAPHGFPVCFWSSSEDTFHWLQLVQLLMGFFLLPYSVLDTAETVIFLAHRRLMPSLVPTPEEYDIL